MALKRILLPVLMAASTTAVLMNNANEDEHLSMAVEVSKLKSQTDSLRQENVQLKLRVQLKDLQAEVARLRHENSMLHRASKVGVFEGEIVYVWRDVDMDQFHMTCPNYQKGYVDKGSIGEVTQDAVPDRYQYECDQYDDCGSGDIRKQHSVHFGDRGNDAGICNVDAYGLAKMRLEETRLVLDEKAFESDDTRAAKDDGEVRAMTPIDKRLLKIQSIDGGQFRLKAIDKRLLKIRSIDDVGDKHEYLVDLQYASVVRDY